MQRKFCQWMLVAAGLAVLAGLLYYSRFLAATRIYQVDECQNVYVAKILANGEAKTSFTSISIFLFPLMWLGRGMTQSVDLYATARFFSLELFWLNIVLLAVATGVKLLSRRGLVALLAAATLAPLWDYGFEVRHDNLLLTGLLLTWCAVRVQPSGLQSYFLAGALALGLEFVAFKSFVYTVPISVAILLFPPPGHKAPRGRLALAWLAGAVAALAFVRVAYGMTGIWDVYRESFHRLSDVSGGSRFYPWQTISRLFLQTPLLLALVTAALVALFVDWRRRGKGALNWSGSLPEGLMFLVALVALAINPVPYPYNLLHLVPYAFLFAWRYAEPLVKEICDRPVLIPAMGAVVIFAHLVPFTVSAQRHARFTNFHQEALIRLAEGITDPAKDPVYDGAGLVPSRRSIGYHWFLHSLYMKNFFQPGQRVRDMLAAQPAAVILTSYRTDWLAKEDREYIRQHYVALTDEFWVLGNLLSAGGGAFEVIHPGRYRITPLAASDLAGTYSNDFSGLSIPKDEPGIEGKLDGVPLTNNVVTLTTGVHHLECSSSQQAAIVWMGPHLERLPRLGQGDHRFLFINWY